MVDKNAKWKNKKFANQGNIYENIFEELFFFRISYVSLLVVHPKYGSLRCEVEKYMCCNNQGIYNLRISLRSC